MGDTADAGPAVPVGPPFLLVCPCCRWSSREAGLEFEKNSGLARTSHGRSRVRLLIDVVQLQKILSNHDKAQPEFDALKDHLETYMSTPVPTPKPARPGATRQPSRHISHLTQMAAKALHRDVLGKAARAGVVKSGVRREVRPGGEKYGWDEIAAYAVKETWAIKGLERGNEDVERMRRLGHDEHMRRGGLGSWHENDTRR
jgi:dynactin-4